MSKICILILTTVALASAKYSPRSSLYSSKDGAGSFIALPSTTYANDLSIYSFNNQAYSTCLVGAWLFYDNVNFNGNGDAAMEYIFEPTYKCVNFYSLGGYVSSAKFVGDASNYRAPTITFYKTTYFQGPEEYVLGDIPQLNLLGISSLIITGQTPWTVYDQPNYAGQGICLTPYQAPDYQPAFVADTRQVSPVIPHGSIRSLRKGCFSSKIVSMPADLNNKRMSHSS